MTRAEGRTAEGARSAPSPSMERRLRLESDLLRDHLSRVRSLAPFMREGALEGRSLGVWTQYLLIPTFSCYGMAIDQRLSIFPNSKRKNDT